MFIINLQQNKYFISNITPTTFLLDLDDDNYEKSLSNFVSFYMSNLPENFSTENAKLNIQIKKK